MEQIYDCTGVCYRGLFKFASNPQTGLPKQSCEVPTQTEVEQTVPTMRLAFFVALCSAGAAFVWHLLLYCKYARPKFEIEYIEIYHN